MDIATIKKVLGIAIPSKTTRRVLSYACAADGFVYSTDLDDTVVLPLDTDMRGMINPKLINVKLGDLSLAVDTTVDEADFPKLDMEKIRQEERTNVPVEMLQDIYSFLPYCSDDVSRAVLCGVCIRPFYVAATSGHVLLERRYECYFGKEELVLSAHAVKLINAMGTPVSFIVYDNYAEIHFHSGAILYTKLVEGPYPKYEKVIPAAHVQRKVPVNVVELKAACQMLEHMIQSKTKMVILQGKEIFTYDRDESKHFRVKMSSDVTPELFDHRRVKDGVAFPETRKCIGFNVRFLLQCLSAFSGSVELEYGKSDIGAVTIRDREKTTLIMPLRVGKETYEEHDFSEIPPVYLDAKPEKNPVKKLKLNKQIEMLALDLQERIGVAKLKETLELI